MQRKLIYGVHPRSFIGNARAAGDLFSRLDPDYVWINPNEDGVTILDLPSSGPLTGKLLLDSDMGILCDSLHLVFDETLNDATGKAWLEALAEASKNKHFVCQLRSQADPRAVAILQFTLPFQYVYIYQGQELGVENHSEEDDIYGDIYLRQVRNTSSLWSLYRQLIRLWKTDPVLLGGELQIRQITEDGVFDFARILGDKAWEIHIDLTHPGASFAMNMEESLKIR